MIVGTHMNVCSFTHPPRCSLFIGIPDWEENVIATGSQSPLHTATQAGAGNRAPPQER